MGENLFYNFGTGNLLCEVTFVTAFWLASGHNLST